MYYNTSTTETYARALHDALPISDRQEKRIDPQEPVHVEIPEIGRRERVALMDESVRDDVSRNAEEQPYRGPSRHVRSEEHTSELQSPCNLVCRILLEKRKKK